MSLMQAIQSALRDEEERIKGIAFQQGVERGRMEERHDIRKETNALKEALEAKQRHIDGWIKAVDEAAQAAGGPAETQGCATIVDVVKKLVTERSRLRAMPGKHEAMMKRCLQFVREQERLNHAASCPGRRGHSSLCGCGGGARMGDFFDIMGDLCALVDDIEAREKAASKQLDPSDCA